MAIFIPDKSISTDSPKITSYRSGTRSPSWSVTGDSVPSASLGSVDETGDCGLVCETKARLEKISRETSNAVCFLRIRTPLCKSQDQRFIMVMERRSDISRWEAWRKVQ